MINSSSSSANSWLASHNTIESLNQNMDSVSVLSDAELQKELSFYADTQFTYDIVPGTAVNDTDTKQPNNNSNNDFKKPQQIKRQPHPQNPDMHSLLNVKLASLAENNYHTFMSPDAIARFYDDSPDCSPPNGYHSPNPSPPNGFHSPNPTPPNGYHLTSSNVGFQGIVNPPITFYGEEAITGYDDDQFMKTMRVLTTSYNEPTSYDHLKTVDAISKPSRKRNSVSAASKKSNSPSSQSELPSVDSEDEDDDGNTLASKKQQQVPLTKEDKRRRNTAASARFRVKKKQREQALQQTANEMTEKAKAFENRVHELEREVKWLKALIVEKKDGHLEQLLMQHYSPSQHGPPAPAPSYHLHGRSISSFDPGSYSNMMNNGHLDR